MQLLPSRMRVNYSVGLSAASGKEIPCVSSFAVRQLRQRQPFAGSSGTGSTCGKSAHQQPGSLLQIIGALHWEQRVCMPSLSVITPAFNIS
jgi:hypothetical protein